MEKVCKVLGNRGFDLYGFNSHTCKFVRMHSTDDPLGAIRHSSSRYVKTAPEVPGVLVQVIKTDLTNGFRARAVMVVSDIFCKAKPLRPQALASDMCTSFRGADDKAVEKISHGEKVGDDTVHKSNSLGTLQHGRTGKQ